MGKITLAKRDTLAAHQKTLFDEDTRLRQDVLELLRRIEESSMSLDAIRKRVEITFGDKAPEGRKRRK